MLRRDVAHDGCRAHVGVEVLALKARIAAAEVAFRILLGALDVARQKSAAEGTERNETDAELAQQRNDARFEIALPQRVLALQRRDRMHRMRAPDGLLARFRYSEKSDLSFGHELRHVTDNFLDRHLGIDAMLIEQIDVIGLESLQRSFDRAPHMLAVQSGRLAVDNVEAELRGDDDLIALAAQRATDQLLILIGPINLGRIEEIDSQLQRPIDRRQRLLLIRRPIRLAHAHAAEPLGRNDETLRSQLALVHGVTLLRPAPCDVSPDRTYICVHVAARRRQASRRGRQRSVLLRLAPSCSASPRSPRETVT